MLASCGEVCDQNKEGKRGKYFDTIRKHVDCKALFLNPDLDEPADFKHPPKFEDLPKWLVDLYTYDGKVEVKHWYWDSMVTKAGMITKWPMSSFEKVASK